MLYIAQVLRIMFRSEWNSIGLSCVLFWFLRFECAGASWFSMQTNSKIQHKILTQFGQTYRLQIQVSSTTSHRTLSNKKRALSIDISYIDLLFRLQLKYTRSSTTSNLKSLLHVPRVHSLSPLFFIFHQIPAGICIPVGHEILDRNLLHFGAADEVS